jgi:peptidylprolyl isomerase
MNDRIFSRVSRMLPICVSVIAFASAHLPVVAAAQAPQPVRPAPTAAKPKALPPTPGAAQAAAVPQTTGAAQPAAAAPAASKAGGDDVVARVGNINLSAGELRGYIAALGARERAAITQDPGLLSQAVRMQLANRLVLQELEAKKWDQQPTVAAQLDKLRENALVELYLQTVATPPASFPSDEEVQQVYDANRAQLVVPRQFQLSQIFVPSPKDAADKTIDEKAKKAVEDIQRKLKAPGADFAVIAIESDPKSGGDLGLLPETQIRPEIRTVVTQLSKGAMSEPIRLDDGYHILKLVDTKASYTRPLAEVRDQLVQQMRNERAAGLRRAYLGELLKEHPPVLNEFALSNLVNEQPAGPAK